MHLEHVEARRKEIVSKYRWARNSLISAIIAGFCYFVFFNNPSGLTVDEFEIIHYFALLLIPTCGYFAGISLAHALCRKDIREYIDLVYESLNTQIYEKHFDNLNFRNSPLKPFDVYDTDLLKVGGNFESLDNITGTYKGVQFKRSSLHIETSPSGEHNSTSTIFKGRWIQLYNINRNIDSFYIIQKNLKTVSKKDGLFKTSQYEQIITDNQTFSDKFEVFVKNKDDTKILTESFMSSILALDYERYLGIYMDHQKIYIAIGGGYDNLSPSIFESLYDGVDSKIEKDIQSIKDLIHMFS